jgi:hypothetical protein
MIWRIGGLGGFAYRIDLDWVPLAIAGCGAPVIAVATTGCRAVWVVRMEPASPRPPNNADCQRWLYKLA